MNVAKIKPETLIRRTLTVFAGLLLFATSPVFAHHLMGGEMPNTFSQGLLAGFGHPIIGLDHFAFLIVAMLLTWSLKGITRYLVPLAFIGASFAGTAIHLGQANIPMSETLVSLSVILVAVLALTRRSPGAFMLSAIFAVSGILHGYAFGESIVGAETTPLVAYLAGLAAIQYALMVGGVIVLDRLATRSEKLRSLAVRFSSVIALLTGGIFFAVSLA